MAVERIKHVGMIEAAFPCTLKTKPETQDSQYESEIEINEETSSLESDPEMNLHEEL